MPDPAPDPREAKLLADLLAMTLAENATEAEAAIEAIRRRAAREGVTGGAVKALAQRLLADAQGADGRAVDARADAGKVVPLRPDRGREAELGDLRWINEDLRRELDETRQARQRAELGASKTQRANGSLAERIGSLQREKRLARGIGFVLGLVAGAALVGGGVLATRLHLGAVPDGVAGLHARLNKPGEAQLLGFLHNCFLASINSLGGGTPFDMHVLMDVDAAGRIVAVSPAADQASLTRDPQNKLYSDLMLKTLASGSCGALPMPASLSGKASHLDLLLPR